MRFLGALFLLQILLGIIFFGTAELAVADSTTTTLINPLEFGETLGRISSPGELVAVAFGGFAALIAGIAIAFTVFSGFKLVIASSEEAIKKAQESLKWSVLGFMFSLLSFTLVSAVAGFLGFQPGMVQMEKDELINPISIAGGSPTTSREFMGALNNVMVNFLGIVAFATTLMIIYYGYRYLTSAGSEQAVEKAKAGLKWAFLGFVITILAFTIISTVRRLFVFGL